MCTCTMYACINELAYRCIHLLALLVLPSETQQGVGYRHSKHISIHWQDPHLGDGFVECPWDIHRLIILRTDEHVGLL